MRHMTDLYDENVNCVLPFREELTKEIASRPLADGQSALAACLQLGRVDFVREALLHPTAKDKFSFGGGETQQGNYSLIHLQSLMITRSFRFGDRFYWKLLLKYTTCLGWNGGCSSALQPNGKSESSFTKTY